MYSRPTTPFIPPNPDRSPARSAGSGGNARPVIPPQPDTLAIPSWYNAAAAAASAPQSAGYGVAPGMSHRRTRSQSTPYGNAHQLPIFAQDPSGGGGGVSDDWIGFGGHHGAGNPYAAFAGMPGSAFSAQHNLPPGTPWSGGGGAAWPPSALHTAYSAFQQPLPAGFGQQPPPLATGFHPGFGGYGGPPSNQGTPWMGGYVPLTPAAPGQHSQLPDPVTGVIRPKMDVQVDTRWWVGDHYGPTLTALQATKLGCYPKINPLLLPPPDDNDREYLTWNMLFSSGHAHRSSDPPTRSWSSGRSAPATFPRVASLRIVSRHLPWILEVRANAHGYAKVVDGGPTPFVTCADVIDTLSDFLHELVPQTSYDSLTSRQKSAVHDAYYHNRSRGIDGDDVPGGRLGEGIKRVDWLGRETMFGGIESDSGLVKERLGLGEFDGTDQEISGRERSRDRRGGGGESRINRGRMLAAKGVPCVFVLRCERRGGVTEDEREANEERGRAATASSEAD